MIIYWTCVQLQVLTFISLMKARAIYICTFLTIAGTKNQENAFKNVQNGVEFPKLSEIVLEALVYTSADSYYAVGIKTWMRK